ncbi:hypothetical protein P171DRAFT_76378 [Karstenula rhodostoma CBS 690.94]|uniref:Uncharacterized protein n=1 Tax=Karstenula rhodostoma CBS 690.94 TaxID=1392251 RepID=A0A9P4PD51_9PLEO|nr:hypothetical protein P171DRAFT_76378 [Karstenula rhodostoma CBS 690.94]
MRQISPNSISSLGSGSTDDAPARQPNDSLSTTPASTAPQSSSTSVKSGFHTSSDKEKGSSPKSSLKTSKSTGSLPRVRFSVPEPPPALPYTAASVNSTHYTTLNFRKFDVPVHNTSSSIMPGLELNALLPQFDNVSISLGCQTPSRTSLDLPVRSPAKARDYKRLSAPAPISRRESRMSNAPPLPPSTHETRSNSRSVRRYNPRVTSFQSVASAASAPAALQYPPTPSVPPSQYNPLQNYVPCLAPNCSNHYTAHLLGPTYYCLQPPYQLIRKRGLCPLHAHQDLMLANQRVKSTYESMRQNCGRKTLGTIAAEFEVFVQQVREERAEESKRMKTWQGQRILPSAPSAGVKGKEGKEKEKVWEEEWDWRYSPRPCTRKGCEEGWYSPFDNRLYLFYTTARPSGFFPLSTLCPSCAKYDVESAAERIEERRRDVGGVVGPEFEEWHIQMGKDRDLEVEYWENAQKRIVREEMGRYHVGAVQPQKTVKEKKSKRLTKLDVCVVM